MIGHEVVLTVINWNCNKICDNLSFLKLKHKILGRGTNRPVTLEFLELGLLIANQVKRILL